MKYLNSNAEWTTISAVEKFDTTIPTTQEEFNALSWVQINTLATQCRQAFEQDLPTKLEYYSLVGFYKEETIPDFNNIGIGPQKIKIRLVSLFDIPKDEYVKGDNDVYVGVTIPRGFTFLIEAIWDYKFWTTSGDSKKWVRYYDSTLHDDSYISTILQRLPSDLVQNIVDYASSYVDSLYPFPILDDRGYAIDNKWGLDQTDQYIPKLWVPSIIQLTGNHPYDVLFNNSKYKTMEEYIQEQPQFLWFTNHNLNKYVSSFPSFSSIPESAMEVKNKWFTRSCCFEGEYGTGVFKVYVVGGDDTSINLEEPIEATPVKLYGSYYKDGRCGTVFCFAMG